MMSPKEALIKDGTIPVKEGRGRLSREAIDRCKWLVANKGWSIKGYEAVKPNSDTAAPAAPVEVKKVAVAGGEKIIHDIIYTYPEDQWKAVNTITGKVLTGKWMGMREVCNTCRVSLVGHRCENPTILGDIPVKIVPR